MKDGIVGIKVEKRPLMKTRWNKLRGTPLLTKLNEEQWLLITADMDGTTRKEVKNIIKCNKDAEGRNLEINTLC